MEVEPAPKCDDEYDADSETSTESSSASRSRSPTQSQDVPGQMQQEASQASKRRGSVFNAHSVRWDDRVCDHVHRPNDAQAFISRILYAQTTETAIGILIIFNFILVLKEIDLRAVNQPLPAWLQYSGYVFYAIYVIEYGLRCFVERYQVFSTRWNNVDLAIVVLGGIEVGSFVAAPNLGNVSALRIFRITRLLRLIRAMRLLGGLRELRKLVEMMSSCFRTLFWSFWLCLAVITTWSAIAVEVLHPIMVEIAADGVSDWNDCTYCEEAFASVMASNLTFFSTIVAGDSWGRIATPVIHTHPWTAPIFCGALLSLTYGVLNLIIAVVVDSFAELRSKDVRHRAAEMDYEEIQEKAALARIFEKCDVDGSGCLTLDELMEGARRVPEFRQRLRVMDIDSGDLQQLFHMLDEDGSGEVNSTEFVDELYRMNNVESKTATKFVKHYVMHIHRQQGLLEKNLDLKIKKIDGLMSAFCRELGEHCDDDNGSDDSNHGNRKFGKWSLLEELDRREKVLLQALDQTIDTSLRKTLSRRSVRSRSNSCTSAFSGADHLMHRVRRKASLASVGIGACHEAEPYQGPRQVGFAVPVERSAPSLWTIAGPRLSFDRPVLCPTPECAPEDVESLSDGTQALQPDHAMANAREAPHNGQRSVA